MNSVLSVVSLARLFIKPKIGPAKVAAVPREKRLRQVAQSWVDDLDMSGIFSGSDRPEVFCGDVGDDFEPFFLLLKIERASRLFVGINGPKHLC